MTEIIARRLMLPCIAFRVYTKRVNFAILSGKITELLCLKILVTGSKERLNS